MSSGASGLSATAGEFSAGGAPYGAGGDPADDGGAGRGTAGHGTAGRVSAGGATAGATATTGGTGGNDAASGDAGASDPTAGNATTGGGSGTSGAPPTAGTSGGNPLFQPVCDDAIVKGSPCNASSIQTCYRKCGPDLVGFKSETCQFGIYDEQPGCMFPTNADYSCYKIPLNKPAQCPSSTVPRAAQPCQTSQCTTCFGGPISSPMYQDSTGMQKQGYCVCSSSGLWTCASSSAGSSSWPCPQGAGCN